MDTAGGFNPIVNFVPIQHHDVTQGMIGYITLGIDTRLIRTGSDPWDGGH